MIKSSYQIETVQDPDKVEAILLMFDSSFPRSLSIRVGCLRKYAQKLAQHADFDVMSIEGKIAGFVACYCNDFSTKCAFLTQIAVADAFRGKGIGGILLKHCIDKTREKGMEKITCQVDEDNAASLKLFLTHGFIFSEKACDRSLYFEKSLTNNNDVSLEENGINL